MRTRSLLGLFGLVLLVILAGAISGCASMQLKPWDRDLLAEPQMSFDPEPMLSVLDEHIYFSKEGSLGGQDASGGGCGCN
jgi:hypothetical protein